MFSAPQAPEILADFAYFFKCSRSIRILASKDIDFCQKLKKKIVDFTQFFHKKNLAPSARDRCEVYATGVLSNFLPLGRIAMHISTLARNSDVVAATLALHPPQSGTE